MTSVVLECRHTDGGGAQVQTLQSIIVVRCSMKSRWASRIWTGVGPQSSNPGVNRGTSKLIWCEFGLAWHQQPHLHPRGSCHQLHRLRDLKWSRLRCSKGMPEEVTTFVAPTQPSAQEPLVLMLPDGAMAEETEMVAHGVGGDVIVKAPVVDPRSPTTAATGPVVTLETITTI